MKAISEILDKHLPADGVGTEREALRIALVNELNTIPNTCKNCKHAYRLPEYKEEHSKGLLFCRKTKYIDEGLDVEKGKIHIFDGDNGEGVGNNVNDYVHEDFGCIHFKEPRPQATNPAHS